VRVFWITIALLAALAPAHAQPVEVASGADLDAWQALEQRRLSGGDAADAYRVFLLTYTQSPLAVAAWSRLLSLEATEGAWLQSPPVRAVAQQVRRRWEVQQANLQEEVREESVAIEVIEDP
jgi:hypothetical protein